MAAFQAATVGRACTVQIDWRQSSGAPSTVKPSTVSAAVTDKTTGWVIATVTDTAPDDATQAMLTVNIESAAAGEVHYCDNCGIFPGAVTAWSRGGLVGATGAIITRSDGLQVRGASSANPVTLPTGAQQAVVKDYEIVPGIEYTYTAEVQASV